MVHWVLVLIINLLNLMYIIHVNVLCNTFQVRAFSRCTGCSTNNWIAKDKYNSFCCLPSGLIISEGHDILVSPNFKRVFYGRKVRTILFKFHFLFNITLNCYKVTLRKVGILNSILITLSML